MATDAERREVARRLRELVPCLFDDGEYIDCGEVEEALGLVNDDGAWYRADGVMRLADLIEPVEPRRTCGDCRHFAKDRFMPCDAAHGHTEADVSACEDFDPLGCDRDALLELADEMQKQANSLFLWNLRCVDVQYLIYYARRIRRALGVSDA